MGRSVVPAACPMDRSKTSAHGHGRPLPSSVPVRRSITAICKQVIECRQGSNPNLQCAAHENICKEVHY